jgi:cell division protein FtsW
VILLVLLVLVGFGLVMAFSASGMVSLDRYGVSTRIFQRQLVSVGIGLLVFWVAAHWDYRRYATPAFIYPALAVTLILLVLPLVLPTGQNVRRWISVGPTRFQPSELAKLGVVVFAAYYLSRYRSSLQSLAVLAPLLGVVGLVLALIVVEPDLGTACIIALTVGSLLFLAGVRLIYLIGLAGLGIPVVLALIFSASYRMDRILAFLNPEVDPSGIGYQIRQSLIAVGSGGWTGLGLTQSKQKLHFLPESHTDFVFAVVGEELGLLGSLVMVALFLLLFWRGVRIAFRADTGFGSLVAMGIVCMVVLQGIFNMCVVVSLLPTKGIPLPFVSVGGSSMLAMMAGIGILLNISRRSLADREEAISRSRRFQ